MRILIAWYSRTGNTERVARSLGDCLSNAEENAVEVHMEEIHERSNRSGVTGWFGAGRDAVLKRSADIESISVDVGNFDIVIIGSPVWAWNVSSPVRAFCENYGREASNLAFFCTMGGSGARGTFRSMEELCGKSPLATLSFSQPDMKDETRIAKEVEKFARSILK